MVSPGYGKRGVRTTRSMLILPKTITLMLVLAAVKLWNE
jgi:hypothetical protein